MTMNPGAVYIANTASKINTAATQPSSRAGRDVKRAVGLCMVVAERVVMAVRRAAARRAGWVLP